MEELYTLINWLSSFDGLKIIINFIDNYLDVIVLCLIFTYDLITVSSFL